MNELGLLYHYLPTELEPSDDAWNRLVEALDDNERNKLEKLDAVEISPPANAWENIALALDELDQTKNTQSFADSFLNMEIASPVSAWSNIEQSLDADMPIRKIGQPTIRRIVTIGLTIAACITGAYFLIINPYSSNISNTKKTEQIAVVNKKSGENQQVTNSDTSDNRGSQHTPIAVIAQNNNENSSLNNKNVTIDQSVSDSERVLHLQNYSPAPVAVLNTTNNKFSVTIGKIKDAFGNMIDRVSDYTTSNGYIAAIGPNGNSVNVSAKLGNMIEFFREDSTANQYEEYLDKVMRESNVWRLKFLDWRKKVDAADANPSQMNFLDPVDLIRFLQENKQ